jgi:hypothetical protein
LAAARTFSQSVNFSGHAAARPGDQGVASHKLDVQADAALATGILQGQDGEHVDLVDQAAIGRRGQVDEGRG